MRWKSAATAITVFGLRFGAKRHNCFEKQKRVHESVLQSKIADYVRKAEWTVLERSDKIISRDACHTVSRNKELGQN